MMKKYKTILFDLDGTLLHTIPDLRTALNYAAKKMGLIDDYNDKEIKSYIGSGKKVLVSKATKKYNLKEEEIEKFSDIYSNYYSEHRYDLTKPFPYVKEVLIELKNRGYNIAVISNKPHIDAVNCVKYYFGDIFDFVVGERHGIKVKPDPEIFYFMAEEFGIEKDKTLYVGDMIYDILFSKNVGMDVALCKFGYGDESLYNQATYLLDSYLDLLKILKED